MPCTRPLSTPAPSAARWKRNLLLSCAMAVLPCSYAFAADTSFYRLESAVSLPTSAPDWDYVAFEPARSYLYIGRRGDGVGVFDVKAGKLVKTIENSQEANATVLVAPFDRGYTVNEDGTSTMFQLSTLKTLKRIPVGEAADAGVFEPVSGQVMITISDEKSVAFLDAKTGAKTGTLKLQAGKFDGMAADGKGNIFVAQRDLNSVARIDAKTRKLTAEWKTTGCEQPTGLAFDAAHHRIFVGCRGKNPVLAVLDSDTGKVVATPEIGRGNDGVIYDPDTRMVYTANGVDANLVIYEQVDADTYRLSEATTTRPYARTMAMDPQTKKIYTVTAEGTVDPSRKVNRGPAPFYPNRYHPDSFTVLTYGRP